jgi:hypothetical protein
MTKKLYKKLKHKNRTRGKHKKQFKGGELIMTETDLQNTHICRVKDDKYKESPGFEVYKSINDAFELKPEFTPYFMDSFQKSNNKWFKFVIFKNNEQSHIYLINGAPINKHSVCMLQGILNVTKKTGEYEEMRDAFNKIIELKSVEGINMNSLEENPLVVNLNTIIQRDIPCMPVISAGSGTVNEDGSICINTKSGHYKPTIESMENAKELFGAITGKEIIVILKEDKEELRKKYGDQYEQFSGICL